jgi:L-fucose mutarotase/ribose pyranase (RbsD/FucU family)
MNLLRTPLLVLACVLPLTALAQWVWVDKDGRKVYSDRSPPTEVPAKNILKQPGMKAPPAAAAAEAAAPVATAKAAASAPRVSGKDKALEDKKKQAEQEEEAKAKAEEQKLAKAKAENCKRAQQAQAAMKTGERIRRPNAKGEMEFISEAERAAETKRIEAVLADCGA